jgi:hypothetical protein
MLRCSYTFPRELKKFLSAKFTESIKFLTATGKESNDKHRQYPHYHTDGTKVTGHETLVLRNASILCKNIIP